MSSKKEKLINEIEGYINKKFSNSKIEKCELVFENMKDENKIEIMCYAKSKSKNKNYESIIIEDLNGNKREIIGSHMYIESINKFI